MGGNAFLTELLGKDPKAAAAEEACKTAFVKQASAEGINLGAQDPVKVNQIYETVWKPQYVAAMQKQAAAKDTSTTIIEKAAAAGASDAVLDKLAEAQMAGAAMFDGWLARAHEIEKAAQEGPPPEGEPPAAPAAPPEAPPAEAQPEQPEAPPEPVEAAKEILETATDEAVEQVAAQAPPETPPEALAQAAAEQVPAMLEAKVGAMVDWLDKNASDKAAAAEYAGQIIDELNKLAAKVTDRRAATKPSGKVVPFGPGSPKGQSFWSRRTSLKDMASKATGAATGAARAVGRSVAAHPYRYGAGAAGALAAGAGVAALLKSRQAKKEAAALVAQKLAGAGTEDKAAQAAAILKARLAGG